MSSNSEQYKPGTKDPEVAAKWARVLELRKAGVTFARIAEEVGYFDASAAHKAYQSALYQTVEQPAREVRQLHNERLDRLLLGHWQRAISGDGEATDKVLKIMARQAALLGLDAPTKTVIEDNVKAYVTESPDTLWPVTVHPSDPMSLTGPVENSGETEDQRS